MRSDFSINRDSKSQQHSCLPYICESKVSPKQFHKSGILKLRKTENDLYCCKQERIPECFTVQVLLCKQIFYWYVMFA